MNRKDGGDRLIYTVKRGRKTIYASAVEIEGPCRCVTGSLACGAAAWIETDHSVTLTNPMSFQESRDVA